MYSRTVIMGRVANDLELKTTQSGKSVCQFRVAVDRRFQKKGEDKQVDFYTVVAWGPSAEFVCRYFAKGRAILVEGEMQNHSYTNANGVTAYFWELVASQISFTGEKAQDTTTAQPTAPRGTEQSSAAAFAAEPADDDYPF